MLIAAIFAAASARPQQGNDSHDHNGHGHAVSSQSIVLHQAHKTKHEPHKHEQHHKKEEHKGHKEEHKGYHEEHHVDYYVSWIYNSIISVRNIGNPICLPLKLDNPNFGYVASSYY